MLGLVDLGLAGLGLGLDLGVLELEVGIAMS
jgi:hypothetical protein